MLLGAESGLYLHIPFCQKRCHYCDFNTYEDLEGLTAPYVQALLRDIELSTRGQRPLATVYLGGGTPSLLEPAQVASLLSAVRSSPGLLPGAEVTLEVNPGTADAAKLAAYRAAGVNRLSFGFQAAQDRHLVALGRVHDAAQSAQAWMAGREAGFDNMSLDLMFGLPGQTADEWQTSLDWALAFKPEHISFYGLTIEPGTRFHHLFSKGKLGLPEDDAQAQMYEAGVASLGAAGLRRYEVSNFALAGREAGHNQRYWRNEPTLGLGAGAWSYDGRTRSLREKNPAKYIAALQGGAAPLVEQETLAPDKARGEAAFLGLRTADGIDATAWQQRYGVSLHDEFGPQIKKLMAQGLLEEEGGRLRLSPKAWTVANAVFEAFV